jgi:hypothetical protein
MPASDQLKARMVRLWFAMATIAGIARSRPGAIIDRRIAGRLGIGAVADAVIALRAVTMAAATATATTATTASGFGNRR